MYVVIQLQSLGCQNRINHAMSYHMQLHAWRWKAIMKWTRWLLPRSYDLHVPSTSFDPCNSPRTLVNNHYYRSAGFFRLSLSAVCTSPSFYITGCHQYVVVILFVVIRLVSVSCFFFCIFWFADISLFQYFSFSSSHCVLDHHGTSCFHERPEEWFLHVFRLWSWMYKTIT